MPYGTSQNIQAFLRMGIWEWVLRLQIQEAGLKYEGLQN